MVYKYILVKYKIPRRSCKATDREKGCRNAWRGRHGGACSAADARAARCHGRGAQPPRQAIHVTQSARARQLHMRPFYDSPERSLALDMLHDMEGEEASTACPAATAAVAIVGRLARRAHLSAPREHGTRPHLSFVVAAAHRASGARTSTHLRPRAAVGARPRQKNWWIPSSCRPREAAERRREAAKRVRSHF